jgi:DNA-binding winged helix-turn-helix (wHTH) protein/tetratricopeptide (TPR) repeat protein
MHRFACYRSVVNSLTANPEISLKKQGKYRFNEFEVDLAHRTLRRDSKTVSIGLRTFDLLAYFVLNAQRVVGVRELLDAVWPDSRAEESDLSQQVLQLRRALTSTRSGDKLVMTIPSGGYMFTPQVKEVEVAVPEATPEPDPQPVAQIEKKAAVGRIASTSAVAVQERETEERDEEAESPDSSEEDEFEDRKRRGLFSGQKRSLALWTLGAVVVIAAVAVAGWYAWRGKPKARQQTIGLVIGEFRNNSPEPLFKFAFQTAATIDLQQSPFVKLASEQDFHDARVSIEAGTSGHSATQVLRAVCKRLNSQAYVNGEIHRLGQKFLFSLEAFDCSDGQSLARSVGIADTADGVLPVLDKVAADLRRQLGESPDSIAKFNMPIFGKPVAGSDTGSLEAFNTFSEARLLSEAGKYSDAVPLLNRAVSIDPRLTLAYLDLGLASANLGDVEMARLALTRAHESRDSVDQYNRLAIIAAYDNLVTGDLQASIRNQREAMALYPQNASFPANLASFELRAGNAAMAIDPARKALTLNPGNPAVYTDLAHAQLSLGQFDEATKTCQKAIEKHLDTAEIHGYLLQIGYLLLDQSAMDEQIAWGRRQDPESREASYMQLQQALMAFAEGRVKSAQASFVAIADSYRRRGQFDEADRVMDALPRMQAEVGQLASAQALLGRLPEANGANEASGQNGAWDSTAIADLAVAWAEVGNVSRAEAMLKRELDAHPQGTLWQAYAGPQVSASIDLNQGHPEAAIQSLQPAMPFDLLSFAAPGLRGRAYLAAKQPELAEVEFHKILDHSGIEPFSYNFPLARLGLARALSAEGKLVDAGQAYKIVFAIWKDADPDLPRLVAAKQEYAKLNGIPARSSPIPARLSATPAAPRALALRPASKPKAAALRAPTKPSPGQN